MSAHLSAEGMTYSQHFVYALRVATKLGIAAMCLIYHSVIPFIHPPRGFDMDSVKNFLNEKCSERVDKNT